MLHREPDNYLFVLSKLKLYSEKLRLAMIAYCLLPNHYHFVVRQDGDQRAGLLPQRLFNSYSKAYNRRYQHSGTLFEGNYRVRVVDTEAYLLHLCRYVHANPLRHGLVSRLEDWPYSNYLEWIGGRRGSLVDLDFVRHHFPVPGSYQDFVKEYLQFPSAMHLGTRG